MPLLGDKPSFGGPSTINKGSRWQYQVPARDPVGIVLHTSEQTPSSNDAINADNLCSLLSKPGSTPNGSGGFYGAGYHSVTDSDPFGWWRVAPDQARPNAAPPCNGTHLHLCIPNRILVNNSMISRATWLAQPLRTHIQVAAEYIVYYSHLYSIPIQRVTAIELASGKKGYCDHQTVSLAFGQSTHIDVGATFPWDVLASDIDLILHPPSPIPPPLPILPNGDDYMYPEIWHDANFIHNIIYVGGGKGWNFASNQAFDVTRQSKMFEEKEAPTGVVLAVQIVGTVT